MRKRNQIDSSHVKLTGPVPHVPPPLPHATFVCEIGAGYRMCVSIGLRLKTSKIEFGDLKNILVTQPESSKLQILSVAPLATNDLENTIYWVFILMCLPPLPP